MRTGGCPLSPMRPDSACDWPFSSRVRNGWTRMPLTARNSAVLKVPEIAGTVAAMTESDPGVESEKASDNTPG